MNSVENLQFMTQLESIMRRLDSIDSQVAEIRKNLVGFLSPGVDTRIIDLLDIPLASRKVPEWESSVSIFQTGDPPSSTS